MFYTGTPCHKKQHCPPSCSIAIMCKIIIVENIVTLYKLCYFIYGKTADCLKNKVFYKEF